MDQTSHFRAVIKAVRSRRSHQANEATASAAASDILPRSKASRCEFSKRARDVTNGITQLREFLLEHRRDYINVTGHLAANHASMSDTVREQIDQEAVQLIQTYQQRIRTLQQDATQAVSSIPAQVSNHQQQVINLLSSYLKAVCGLHSEQRAVRVRQLVEKQRLSRLETKTSDVQPSTAASQKPDSSLRNRFSRLSKHWSSQSAADVTASGQHVADLNPAPAVASAQESDDDEELSESERMAFEQENIRLPEEMDMLKDEVRRIEGSILEISKLQEVFSENIMNQADKIDRVADTVVESTDNIQSGNENIREAIKNNASWRVWVIFFLLMCSVCLLFLDWFSS